MKAAAESPNVALRLGHWATKSPKRVAVVSGRESLSFLALDEGCARLGAGLESVGISRGTRVAMMVPPGIDFFAVAFALFRIGAVPILIDPGLGFGGLGRCLAEAGPEAFIGSPKAHLARWLGGWGRPTLKVLVSCGAPWPGAHSGARLARVGAGSLRAPVLPEPGETAAILFTSGSTGAPKGAVYTHEMFSAQVELLEKAFAIEPGEVSVPTFPLFGLFDVALGMTAVLPRMDYTRPAAVDPREIVGAVQSHQATQLFGSPALLDAVGRFGEEHGVRLPSLKRVISAGAPVPPRTLKRFAGLLRDEAEIFTPYGATEALPVAVIGSKEIIDETAAGSEEGLGACVGRVVPGLEVHVIRIGDVPIKSWSHDLLAAEGEIGEIVVKGPVVSARYEARPADTALAKIAGRDGAVYHRMGDLGSRDGLGRLWFCGRKSHRVRTSQGTLYTIPCEGVFNANPKVRRTALVGVGAPGAQIPVLCVELEPEFRRHRVAVREELFALASRHEHTRAIETILFHDAFPVDIRHNAKIFREKLAAWAARRL
ncbi:MAG: AMP-binding protein [Elusimicrobia bacterium]|nr:AMP-binding protein [Elusimicrobiota bacterium]